MTASTGPVSGLVGLTLRLGGLAWVSDQLSLLQDRWASSMVLPAASAHLATQSRHHQWHASLWTEALPDSPALAAAEQVGAPTKGWATALESIDAMPDTGDAARLAVLYRGLVPRALTLIDDVIARSTGPGDVHIARVGGFVHADVAVDAERGHSLLEATLGDDETIEIVSSATKALDQAFRSY